MSEIEVRRTHYSPREVAKMFGVSARTVLNLIHTRELPAVRVGAQWRIAEQSLRAFTERAVTEFENERVEAIDAEYQEAEFRDVARRLGEPA